VETECAYECRVFAKRGNAYGNLAVRVKRKHKDLSTLK